MAFSVHGDRHRQLDSSKEGVDTEFNGQFLRPTILRQLRI